MAYQKRLLIISTILFSCIGCDQATKATAQKYLADAQPVSYFGDIFRLQYMENIGGFLSLGSGLPAYLRFWLLIVFTGIFIAGMLGIVLVCRTLRPAFVVGISLIVGGGIGNLIDRTFNNGAVIDFMNIGIGSVRTGIFNVADLAIMAGAGILIVLASRNRSLMENS